MTITAAAGAPSRHLKRNFEGKDRSDTEFKVKKARTEQSGSAPMSDAPLCRTVLVARPAVASNFCDLVVPLQESARKCYDLMSRYEAAKTELATIAKPFLHIESFKQANANILQAANEKICKAMQFITENGNNPKAMKELAEHFDIEFERTKDEYRLHICLLERYLLRYT